MDKEQKVSDMANEVLARQAEARAERTGEPLEEALEAVLKTESGSQLRDLRDGTHRAEKGARVAGKHRSGTGSGAPPTLS